MRVNRYPRCLQRLVYLAGVELERLQVGDLRFIRFEGCVYLARQGPVCLPGQHNPQQVDEQLRVPLPLDYLQRSAQVDLVDAHAGLVVEGLPLYEGAYLDDEDRDREGLAYIRVHFVVPFIPQRLHFLRAVEVGQSGSPLFGFCEFIFYFDVSSLVEDDMVGGEVA